MTDTSGRAGTSAQAPIVVGVDGSESAQDALDWAAAEATATGRPLHIVHAFTWPILGSAFGPFWAGPADDGSYGGLYAAAEQLLAEAELHAWSAASTVKVTTELVVGPAVPALLRQAEHAELMVLGSRGLGGFSALLVGSVSAALAAHAACPVVVVHNHPDHPPGAMPTGPVVVGVDGSELSSAAIAFAFLAAARRGTGVLAVQSGTAPERRGPFVPVPLDWIEESEQRMLSEALAGERRKFPGVPVRRELVHAHPAQALVEKSAGAALVVVGSRGRGGFAGMLLGSVSRAVLQHAGCPVAVVRSQTAEPVSHHRHDRSEEL